jgi:hypothetical protein
MRAMRMMYKSYVAAVCVVCTCMISACASGLSGAGSVGSAVLSSGGASAGGTDTAPTLASDSASITTGQPSGSGGSNAGQGNGGGGNHSSNAPAGPPTDSAQISFKNLTQVNAPVVKIEIDYTCTHAAASYNDAMVLTLHGFSQINLNNGNSTTPLFTCDGKPQTVTIAQGSWTESTVAGTTQPLDWAFLIGGDSVSHGEAVLTFAANKDLGTVVSVTDASVAQSSSITIATAYECVYGNPTAVTNSVYLAIQIGNAAAHDFPSESLACDGIEHSFAAGYSAWLKSNFNGGPQPVTVQIFVNNSLASTKTVSITFS